MPKMKQLQAGDFIARQTSEYWNVYYKNDLIGSGDDELGIRLDVMNSGKDWYNADDFLNLHKLAEQIRNAG